MPQDILSIARENNSQCLILSFVRLKTCSRAGVARWVDSKSRESPRLESWEESSPTQHPHTTKTGRKEWWSQVLPRCFLMTPASAHTERKSHRDKLTPSIVSVCFPRSTAKLMTSEQANFPAVRKLGQGWAKFLHNLLTQAKSPEFPDMRSNCRQIHFHQLLLWSLKAPTNMTLFHFSPAN